MRGSIRHASFVRKRGFPKLGELPDAGRGLLRIRSNQPINRKAIMRRKVIPWPCEPASSIAVVATSCLALFALSSRPVMAQTVHVPDPGSFDAFVERHMPGLIVERDKGALNEVFRLSSDDGRHATLTVDPQTRLVVPESPFPPMEALPRKDPRTLKYARQLREFLECREQLLQLRLQYLQLLGDKRRLELPNAAAPIKTITSPPRSRNGTAISFGGLRANQRTSLFVLATRFDRSWGQFRRLTSRLWGHAPLPTDGQ